MDLEKASVEEVAGHLRGADAVVFAAGAGPGSGAARKETVDRDAAILLADAAQAAGVDRYLMISAMGAHPEATADDPVFEAYLCAKGAADEAVRARDTLRPTIVRPGLLTNDPGTGARDDRRLYRPREHSPRRRRGGARRSPGRTRYRRQDVRTHLG